jgi:site-specific recombinase XerD
MREGPLFRTFDLNGKLSANRVDGRDVTRAIKRLATDAGLPDEQIARIASHSLRRGFVTSADRAGASVHSIMKVTLHKDRRTVDVYVKRDLEKDSPLLDIFGAPRESAKGSNP